MAVKRKKKLTIDVDIFINNKTTPDSGVTHYSWPEGTEVLGLPKGCTGIDVYGGAATVVFKPVIQRRYRGFLNDTHLSSTKNTGK